MIKLQYAGPVHRYFANPLSNLRNEAIPDNRFFAGGWQVPRNADDMESTYWLCNRTGDPKLLELTAKLQRCGSSWMSIVTGDPKWADRCESIAFNTLPATMTADMKALRNLTSPNQVNSDARSGAPELADAG